MFLEDQNQGENDRDVGESLSLEGLCGTRGNTRQVQLGKEGGERGEDERALGKFRLLGEFGSAGFESSSFWR